jgi:Fur family transcriptional regulator, ferric uptake regulator
MSSIALSNLQTTLREHRRKLTLPRQSVLDIISEANHHLTPAEILRQAKARHLRLGLTSVYRTLDLLVNLGYVQRIHLNEGCHSYATIGRSHGHHLVCSNCGRAEEFSNCDLDSLVRGLQKKTGFKIRVHMLELMGLCPECQINLGKGG